MNDFILLFVVISICLISGWVGYQTGKRKNN